MANEEITLKLLDEMSDAYNRVDLDAVMSYFAEDAVFDQAVGPNIYGTRIEGAAAIRATLEGLFGKVERVHWETLDARISGNKAFCEYRRTAKMKSGEEQDFQSVDVLTFKDGKIVHKDTYYKNRVAG